MHMSTGHLNGTVSFYSPTIDIFRTSHVLCCSDTIFDVMSDYFFPLVSICYPLSVLVPPEIMQRTNTN